MYPFVASFPNRLHSAQPCFLVQYLAVSSQAHLCILAFGITPLSPELPSITLASHGYSNTCDDPVTDFTQFLVNFSHSNVKAQVDHLYMA